MDTLQGNEKQRLTGANFWDEIRTQYPEAFTDFLNWYNQYKKQIDWDSLFRATPQPDGHFTERKLHELPAGLQMGIIMYYFLQYDSASATLGDMIRVLKTNFKELNGYLTRAYDGEPMDQYVPFEDLPGIPTHEAAEQLKQHIPELELQEVHWPTPPDAVVTVERPNIFERKLNELENENHTGRTEPAQDTALRVTPPVENEKPTAKTTRPKAGRKKQGSDGDV